MKNLKHATPILSDQTLGQGVNAQSALDAAAREIANQHLRQFFKSVTQEPEILLALTIPLNEAQVLGTGYDRTDAKDRFPIQILQRAGCTASRWCTHRPLVHDVLYVAMIVLGARQLIQCTLSSGADLDDVLFTLIRPALHRLDDRHPQAAGLLRGVLDLGNDDDPQVIGVSQIRNAAMTACQLLHRNGASKDTNRQVRRFRSISGAAQSRQVYKARRVLACSGCDWEKAL